MNEMTLRYNNADGEFRFDEPIRWAMSRWPGEEADSGQNLESHTRHITFAFEDEGDDSAALEDLAEILGDRFREITYTGQPVERITAADEPKEPEPTILKAIYYSEPDWSDDAILAEIVMHGGETTYSSKCLCCNRREIAALFGDRAKALDAGEALEANWDAEVEILPFGKALGGHASQDNFLSRLIMPICAENRNAERVVGHLSSVTVP